jgi:hypothetical protein
VLVKIELFEMWSSADILEELAAPVSGVQEFHNGLIGSDDKHRDLAVYELKIM